MNQETVTGDGIILRPWRDEDAGELARAIDDPQIARFLPHLPRPYTAESARWWIREGSPQAWAQGGADFAVIETGTSTVLAGAGISRVLEDKRQAEVGYWVAPWARRKGVATRATATLAAWAFGNGLQRLELLVANDNYPSQRVALGAGFTREGVRRMHGVNRDGSRKDLIAFVRLDSDPGGPAPRRLPDLPGGSLSDDTVTLRPLGPDDVDDYHALMSLPEVSSGFIGGEVTLESSRRRCEEAPTRWLAGDMAAMVIEVDGVFAGDIALHYREPFLRQAMLGYALRPEFRGRGLMTRAVNLVSEWAFESVGVIRAVAGTFPDNVASQRVLERAGFVREAYQKAALPGPDGKRIDNIQFTRLSSLA